MIPGLKSFRQALNDNYHQKTRFSSNSSESTFVKSWKIFFLLAGLIFLLPSCWKSNKTLQFENEKIVISLAFDESNLPYIKTCTNKETNAVLFRGRPSISSMNMLTNDLSEIRSSFREDKYFKYMEVSCRNDTLKYSWVFKLMNNSNSYSSQVKIKNISHNKLTISEYPVWDELILTGESISKIKYWKSLSYKPEVKELTKGTDFSISSAMYSSDKPNEVP